jgi:hypothetical protein
MASLETKTTIPGLKFVVRKLFTSKPFAAFFINLLTDFMSADMDLGRLPLHSIEISEWILRIEKLELGIDTSPWKGLRGIYRMAEFLHRMEEPSFAESLLKQVKVALPPEALNKIKENLERSAFDEVNRLCNEALRKAGANGTTFDIVALLAITRAAQTGYRCIARYRVSPIQLIERARLGDRRAVLELIKLDKLFSQDSCTQSVLRKALLSSDKLFNDQVARAQLFVPTFNRRDACEFYMMILAGLRINLPPLHKLRAIIDPDRTAFTGDYAFEKCFERRKRGLRLDSSDDEQSGETCLS